MPILKLISRNRIPYGGRYELFHTDKGLVGMGTNWDMLLTNVVEYRKSNGFPIGLGFESELEQQVCLDYPNECEGYDDSIPKKRQLNMDDVLRGTKAIGGIVLEWGKHFIGLSESPMVSQEEANKRAEQCKNCYLNSTFSKPCTGLCPELSSLINSIKGSKSTPFDNSGYACNICGCLTSAHIWFRLDLLARGVNEEQKKQFDSLVSQGKCWKKLP